MTPAQPPRRYIGTFGCQAANRVIRVAPLGVGPGGHPKALKVACPCGSEHLVKPFWRRLAAGERADYEATPINPADAQRPRRFA